MLSPPRRIEKSPDFRGIYVGWGIGDFTNSGGVSPLSRLGSGFGRHDGSLIGASFRVRRGGLRNLLTLGGFT